MCDLLAVWTKDLISPVPLRSVYETEYLACQCGNGITLAARKWTVKFDNLNSLYAQ